VTQIKGTTNTQHTLKIDTIHTLHILYVHYDVLFPCFRRQTNLCTSRRLCRTWVHW